MDECREGRRCFGSSWMSVERIKDVVVSPECVQRGYEMPWSVLEGCGENMRCCSCRFGMSVERKRDAVICSDECRDDKRRCDMFWMSVERIGFAVICSG
jgi:hypothetical protein